MRGTYFMLVTLLIFSIILLGCQNNETTDEVVRDLDYEETAQASNDFGFQVLEKLAGVKITYLFLLLVYTWRYLWSIRVQLMKQNQRWKHFYN